jgi:hypothetical protein
MATERRINLRFLPEQFDQLDEKRFRAKTTFQDIGVQLFEQWLSGERLVELHPIPKKPAPDPLLEKIAVIRASGDKEMIALIHKAVDAFYGVLRHSLTTEEIEQLKAASNRDAGVVARYRRPGAVGEELSGERKKGTRKSA